MAGIPFFSFFCCFFWNYIGYPTHFGQLECMKLTASPHFPEKRIGYLGMLLLLSEEAEVLMLATNALKSDLVSDNKFVSGLALCAIGNLATADMSRDLAPEVDKHLKSPLSYLRKKACLAMSRCLTKCPDMVEDFVERVTSLLQDKSHGVLVTVVQLMTQVLMIDYQNAKEGEDDDDPPQDPYDTDCRRAFLKLVPTLTKMLRNLLGSGSSTTGYMMESEVSGISDPFLQVQLLTLLRLLGTNNSTASEEMNDVLAQVATNTESAKNAGNAILYECVLTIMGIESEDGLRVLAINILGRFLLNRDNNIRYVALNTLAKCIVEQKRSGGGVMEGGGGGTTLFPSGTDGGSGSGSGGNNTVNNAMSALQRHRTTVVDCLKDPDVSIRQRTLELIYHLVNADNVQQLVGELLNYLVLCPREHRGDICRRILKVVDRYTPVSSESNEDDDESSFWRVDTLITTLTIAGREANQEVPSATAVYISRSSATVHAFATHKLVKALRDDDGSQHGLLAVAIWCIGEYGDFLLQPYTYTPPVPVVPTTTGTGAAADSSSDGGDGTAVTSITFMQLEPLSIVDTIAHVTKRMSCPEYIKERALTAYAKLNHRFLEKKEAGLIGGVDDALERLQTLLQKEGSNRSLEMQLRACEYRALVHASQGLALPKIPKPQPPVDDDNKDDNGNTTTTNNTTEADLFGVMTETPMTNGDASSAPPPSSGVISAAKEALSRMPIVDAKILQKRLMSNDEFSYTSSTVSSNADGAQPTSLAKPVGATATGVASSLGGDLLDFSDTAVTTTTQPLSTTNTTASSDLELLADIFAAPQPTTTGPAASAAAPSNTLQPGMDLFGPGPTTTTTIPTSTPATTDIFGVSAPTPATSTTAVNMFGAPPPAAAATAATGAIGAPNLFAGNTTSTMAPTSAAATTTVNPLDLFGPGPSSTGTSQPLATTAPSVPTGMAPSSSSSTTANDMFGAPAAAPMQQQQPPTQSSVRVPAIEFNGLVVEFECTKPDTWNKQISRLVAHFRNNNPEPLYGLNLQVAVPKYMTMEMSPATSTTIPPTPPTESSSSNSNKVTQIVMITNSQFGTKNMVLKLKLSFSYQGQKMEHMATCSGFPAGEY